MILPPRLLLISLLISLLLRLDRCEGVRVQSLLLHKVALPLVGGPSWLKLHQAAVFEEPEGKRLLLIDYLPEEPESPATALSLFTMNSVAGKVRVKELTSFPYHGEITETIETDCDMDALALNLEADYDRRLRLTSNNCRTFVSAVVAKALSASGDGAAAP